MHGREATPVGDTSPEKCTKASVPKPGFCVCPLQILSDMIRDKEIILCVGVGLHDIVRRPL